MRAYFSLLYPVAISANKRRKVSNHTKWWEDLQRQTYFFLLGKSSLTHTRKVRVQGSSWTNDEGQPKRQNPQFLGQKQGQPKLIHGVDSSTQDYQKLQNQERNNVILANVRWGNQENDKKYAPSGGTFHFCNNLGTSPYRLSKMVS